MVILAALLLVAIVLLPQAWVLHTISLHARERPDLDGTGGELARHLLNRFDLSSVRVETTDRGDHYDPEARVVRLSPRHHDGRSLAAVAIAAHEVGHAIQHAAGDRSLTLRQRLATLAMTTDRLAGLFFIAAPVVGAIARTPLALAVLLCIGIALLAVRVLFTIVSLPVEIDASFGKALPILRAGNYLDERDLPAVKSVLRAAAFTYVAGALIALVNLARWIRLLR